MEHKENVLKLVRLGYKIKVSWDSNEYITEENINEVDFTNK